MTGKELVAAYKRWRQIARPAWDIDRTRGPNPDYLLCPLCNRYYGHHYAGTCLPSRLDLFADVWPASRLDLFADAWPALQVRWDELAHNRTIRAMAKLEGAQLTWEFYLERLELL